MNIGINSRFVQNQQSGIPYFISSLYKKITKIDKKNSYSFFQTKNINLLGKTKIVSTLNNSIGNVLFDLFLINNAIKKKKISLFHGPANILPLKKLPGIKYVLTVHDLSFLLFPENGSALFNLYYKYCVQASLHNADLIIADSKHTQSDIINFYSIPKNKIKVIYLGVNDMFIRQKKYKSPIDSKYFFTLTTHPQRKNIYALLNIYAKHQTLQNELEFVIAGLIPEAQKKELISKINSLGLSKKVKILGYVNEEKLISLYQHASFFIYPSFYEGFGLPVIEAAYSHCPVLASNVSSIPEIVAHKDWLFNPHDKSDITDKINTLMSLSLDKRNAMIQKNYESVQQFRWEFTAKQYIEVFNNLI